MKSETRVVIPGRLSYVNIWEPKSFNGNKAKYSVSIIIPKSDKKTINNVLKAIEEAKKKSLQMFGGTLPKNFNTPLRDGDIDRPDDPSYKGCYFINASGYNQPKVVDRRKEEILDRSEVYSGCYGNVSVNMYAYNTNGNKGISAGLGHVQKVEDGEPLGGFFRAEDDFDVLDDEDDFLA